jgi:hypothetical protein
MSGYAIANGIGFNSLGFSPKSISNLQLWHDATDIGTQGYSLDFDGTNDYAQADNEITAYPFTLECWAKFDVVGTTQQCLAISDSTSISRNYFINMVTNKIGMVARNTTSESKTGTTIVVADTWYHIAGVFASDIDRKLYVNGILEASDTTSVTFNNVITNQVLMGLHRTSTPTSYLNGKLSDARIWNTERTSAEIYDNYNKRLIGNETGLVGYWKLSEGTSLVAKDFTSNANDATITDAVWIVDEPFSNGIISDFTSVRIWKDKSINGYDATQATSANRPTYRSNQIDSKATIQFDGTDDFLSLPSGALGILRNVAGATIFLVAKHSTDLTVQTGVWFTNGTAAGQVRILLRKSASNFFNTSGRRLDADTAESVTSTTTNVGNYILQSAKIDYQNTLLEQFLNNTLDGQDLIYLTSGNTSDTDSLNASLGATNIGSYLNGNIAEVLIYNRTLSTAEFTNVNKYLMAKWGL